MSDLKTRITAYLSGGGLFNPELANHGAVRDLIIDCRKELAAAQDTRIREGIEVEKMLCDVLGRPWAASGFSIETLILDIKAELAELKARVEP